MKGLLDNLKAAHITGHISFEDRFFEAAGLEPLTPVRFHLDEFAEDPSGPTRIGEGWGQILVSFPEPDIYLERRCPSRWQTWEMVFFDIFIGDEGLDVPRLQFNPSDELYIFGHRFAASMAGLNWLETRLFQRRFRCAAKRTLAAPGNGRRFGRYLRAAAEEELAHLISMGHLAYRPGIEVLERLLAKPESRRPAESVIVDFDL